MKNSNQLFKEPDGRQYYKDHYVYKAIVSTLTAGSTLTSQIQIEANADFVWVKSAYFADIAGAAQTESSRVIPLVRVAITDSGSGRNLQNLPVPVASLAGHGGLPLNLPQPRIFNANSNISLTFANYSAATDYGNVELSLIGYKKIYL